jgi:hypothetical protein
MALVLDGTLGLTYTGFTGATTNFAVPLSIGVGTASPLTGIHLESSTSESNRTLRIGYDGTYYATIAQGGAAGVYYRAFGGLHHIWEVGGTEYMRINNSGNVGIGTSSPNKKLEVLSVGEIIRATSNTGANDQVISIKSNSGTADCSTNIFFADRYAATSYASSYIRGTSSGTSALIFATGGTNFTNIYDAGAPTERMRISSTGAMSLGTTATGVAGEFRATNAVTAFYSDRRLKTEISKIENALDKIDQLTGVVYTQNKLAEEFGYNDYSEQVGLYADDVKRVQPQVVKPAPFDLDENNTSKSGENYLTVQYEKLVPLLVQGIKELRQEINALKGQ